MPEDIDPKVINYYLILGLDYDDDSISDDIINSTIKAKQLEWSSRSRGSESTALYLKYLELVNTDIPSVMFNPVLRKTHAEAAKDILGNSLLMQVMRFSKNNNLTEENLEIGARFIKTQFEKKNGIRTLLPPLNEFKDFVAKKAKAANIKIIVENRDFKDIFEKYYKTKPENADKFDSIGKELNQLGFSTLYEFLDEEKSAPIKILQTKAEGKKKNLPVGKADHTLAEHMCNAALEAFKDDKVKNTYDEYCLWKQRKDILDELGRFAKNTGLTEDVRNEYFTQLSRLIGPKLADDLIIAYCKEKKIKDVNDSSKDLTKIKVCRKCKKPNLLAEGQKSCRYCGTPFFIKCPNCGKEIPFEVGVDVCSCGYRISSIEASYAILKNAEKQLDILNLDLANSLISDAEAYWKDNPEITRLKEKLSQAKNKFGEIHVQINNAIENKCFFKAQKYYNDILIRIPGYKDESIKNIIEARVKESESYYQLARTKTSEEEILEICNKALAICCDNEKINSLIQRYPPAKPPALTIKIDNVGKQNILSWLPSPSTGVNRYRIVRKIDNAPNNENDGELVEYASSCTFIDKKIEPGVCYYYAIFSERAGLCSQPLLYQRSPVWNTFELPSFNVTQGNRMVKIEWPLPPKNTVISLYRSKNGENEKQIRDIFERGYIDSGLEDNTQYTYRLTLTYSIRGESVQTKGISQTVMVISPPKEIDSLCCHTVSNNVFELSWENPENSNIQFYAAEIQPNYKIGEIIPIIHLEQNLKKFSFTKIQGNTGIFNYTNEGILYVTCVATKGNIGVIGNFVRIRNSGPFSINAVELVNNQITIWPTYPKDTTGFIISCSFDKFVTDPYDKTVPIRKYTSLRSFLNDGSNTLHIDNPENREYYISLFCESKIDGIPEYTDAVTYLFKNSEKIKIEYQISTQQKGLFGQKKSHLSLECNAGHMIKIPDIDIYAANLRPPMFASSGTYWSSILGQSINGTLDIPLRIPQGSAKNMHIKLFFKNKVDYEKYELSIKADATTRVT